MKDKFSYKMRNRFFSQLLWSIFSMLSHCVKSKFLVQKPNEDASKASIRVPFFGYQAPFLGYRDPFFGYQAPFFGYLDPFF